MVAEVFAGISGFKAMLDTAKSLKDMNDSAVRKGVVIELQEQILSAQEAQFELIEQVSALKTQIAHFETWEEEKQRYELRNVGAGFGGDAFAFVLKEQSSSAEPPHWICANCYQNRKKSILQPSGYAEKSGPELHKIKWSCPACQSSIRVSHNTSPNGKIQ